MYLSWYLCIYVVIVPPHFLISTHSLTFGMPVGRSVMYDTDARKRWNYGIRMQDGRPTARVGSEARELGGPDESGKAKFNVQLEVLARTLIQCGMWGVVVVVSLLQNGTYHANGAGARQ